MCRFFPARTGIDAAVARFTRGNFRRFTQVERIMKVNELSTITDYAIEAARARLCIDLS
jgi:ribosomal protein L16/L10AE